MKTRYLALSEFDAFGIDLPDGVRYQLENVAPTEPCCQLCGATRAPRNYHDPAPLAEWVEHESHRVANLDRFDHVGANRPKPVAASKVLSELPEELDRCVCCDSQLQATIGVPLRVLHEIWPKMSATQRTFLSRNFLIVMCNGCRTSPASDLETAESIERTFVSLLADGDVKKFTRDDAIDRFREILALIAAEIRPISA